MAHFVFTKEARLVAIDALTRLAKGKPSHTTSMDIEAYVASPRVRLKDGGKEYAVGAVIQRDGGLEITLFYRYGKDKFIPSVFSYNAEGDSWAQLSDGDIGLITGACLMKW